MRHRWIFCAIALLSALTILPLAHTADEQTSSTTTATTPKANPESSTTASTTTATSTTTTTTTTTTTPKPKINIAEHAVCKKCECDKDNKQIDCSGRLGAWFTDDEWTALQNGDLIFETIKLEHNNLTNVPQLPEYPVKNLFLGFNQIANITIAAFQKLSLIRKIDLSHNRLTTKALVPDVFKGTYAPDHYVPLDNMRELDLGDNDLHTLHQDLFEHLPHLEVLILCKNIFHTIDQLAEAAISGLTSLKTLDLSYMELAKLPDNFLHGPRDLEVLILTGNLFTKLPAHLEFAVNLKVLNLDENAITDLVDDHVFPEMNKLEVLSMSYMTELTKIGPGALSNLPNLTELLVFSNAKLTSIDAKAFAKTTINAELYDYPPLTTLHIHNNNLTVFEHDWIASWYKVTKLDVRFNPWICDCTNHYLIHTLMNQINKSTPLLATDVTCASPMEFKGVELMSIRVGTGKQELNCGEVPVKTDTLLVLGLFIGILIGIPLTIGTFMIYRRGCFGLIRQNGGAGSSLYNRASFSDDFHI